MNEPTLQPQRPPLLENRIVPLLCVQTQPSTPATLIAPAVVEKGGHRWQTDVILAKGRAEKVSTAQGTHAVPEPPKPPAQRQRARVFNSLLTRSWRSD
jgi:hypothetical protein